MSNKSDRSELRQPALQVLHYTGEGWKHLP
jgi:hypothetical protein